MTHEQKPESAEFRTREAQHSQLGEALSDEVSDEKAVERWYAYALKHILEAEARGAAEQRQDDEEKRELISANLDRPELIEWSVHILGPDEAHPCRSRAEAEALAYETNILAGKTNKGRVDDEFVSYAAYVVPRFRADQEAEQRRKDVEGAEPSAWRWRAKIYKGEQYGPWILVDHDPTPNLERGFYDIHEVEKLYTRPANVAALEARVKELEGEIRSIRERVKGAASSVMGIRTDAMNGDNLAITLASYFEDLLGEHDPNGWHPGAQKACDEIEAAIVAHMGAAIREGGEHG